LSSSCFGHRFSQAKLPKATSPATIRVLLTKLAEDALVEVKGRYILYNPKTDRQIFSGSKKKRARISTKNEGLFWGDNYPDIFELKIVPATTQTSILVNGVPYPGAIDICSIGGTINIVNEVDLDTLLKATLPQKIKEDYSAETLEAIAITERTHLSSIVHKAPYASWHVDANELDYHGAVSIKQNSHAQAAIERTKEIVLHYHKKPFAAGWAPNHAGKSTSYPSIYRRLSEVPQGVKDLPSTHLRDQSKWTVSLSLREFAKSLNLTNVKEIDLYQVDKTCKNYGIRVVSQEGTKDLDLFALYNALGPNILPSNDFTLKMKGKRIEFTGYGQGNGVGLCALSAEILSKKNAGVNKILKTHFPDTELVNLRFQRETGANNHEI
jgi:stage II sporulation protein D